jgi:hypothetical protein
VRWGLLAALLVGGLLAQRTLERHVEARERAHARTRTSTAA